ncbi:MAG: 4-hydroxy-tetrahydrodipicolinate synthase [Gemmatimonadota bacterium]|nr:MAG: 4-hydroxy-tetrahydrodipicolinate synthase [Gemmatimonadota bacterium]
MFTGLYVAMVTPFDRDGKVNEEKIREMVRFHIENGTNGLVPCGTTGENPTFTWEEHFRVVEVVVDEAKGKLKVVANAGTFSTTKSIENVKKVKDLGADGAMTITPYYNKPTQEGLKAHFLTLADSTDIPLLIYNVPGRTGVNLLPKTLGALADHDNIAAVKEASGSLTQMTDVVLTCGDRVTMLSGDDGLTLPAMAVGGKGVVSVVGNIVPQDMKAMITAFERGDIHEATTWHHKLFPLCEAMFIETNPMPVKEAMNMTGWDVGDVRLPLVRMLPENREKLKSVLRSYDLLK